MIRPAQTWFAWKLAFPDGTRLAHKGAQSMTATGITPADFHIDLEESMKLIKPLLIGFSLLAFTGAYAADEKKSDTKAKPAMSDSKSSSSAAGASAGTSGTGTSAKGSSKASNGSSTMAERMNFDKADKNNDGQLSREEFNRMMSGAGQAPSSAAATGTASGKSATSAAGTSSAGKASSGASGTMAKEKEKK